MRVEFSYRIRAAFYNRFNVTNEAERCDVSGWERVGSWGGGVAFDSVEVYIAKGETGPCERFHFVSDHVSLLLWMSNIRERESVHTIS